MSSSSGERPGASLTVDPFDSTIIIGTGRGETEGVGLESVRGYDRSTLDVKSEDLNSDAQYQPPIRHPSEFNLDSIRSMDSTMASKMVQTEEETKARNEYSRKEKTESERIKMHFEEVKNIDKATAEKDIDQFFDHIGFDKNTPFSEKDIEEFEKDLDFENKTPKQRIYFVPAKRFSNFGYHHVLSTYVPFTVDLSHMNLLSLNGIEFMFFVSYINASNNQITDKGVKHLEGVDDLIALLMEKNKLTCLNFPLLTNLMLLDLTKNEISWIHEDFKLPSCESLIINYNQLKEISKLGKESVPKLKLLSLKSNYISDLDVDWPRNLQHLYLGENDISDPKGLTGLTRLKTLHLRSNRIASLKEFPKDLLSLEYLNLRSNELHDAFEIGRLKYLPSLRTLILLDNPCTYQGESQESYRIIVLSCLRQLERLDKRKVTAEELEKADQMCRIFGDDLTPAWGFNYRLNEEGEGEMEIQVESPDTDNDASEADRQRKNELSIKSE